MINRIFSDFILFYVYYNYISLSFLKIENPTPTKLREMDIERLLAVEIVT